jgi:diacylglycerol kinase (ATP)
LKPKYSLKNNFFYAIDGLKILSREKAFRIEFGFFLLLSIALFFFSYPLWAKLFMFCALFIPLIAEAFNTAIEKSVDLIQDEYHILAKHAKDIAAFGVLLSIIITAFIWLGFIVYFYK